MVSRRGGGTPVLDRANDPLLIARHHRRLSSLVNSHILEAFSLGYSPEELETSFQLHLARWQEERKEEVDDIDEPVYKKKADVRNLIRIVGSHDLALGLMVNQFMDKHPETKVEVTHAGSLGG